MSKADQTTKKRAARAPKEARGTMLPFYIVAGFFSLMINLLMLVSPLYMLQIYDRVMTSGSMETLIWVSLVAVGLLSAFGFAEAARRKTMTLAGEFLQAKYGPAILRESIAEHGAMKSLQSKQNDLNAVQTFHQSGLSLPLFDLPFTPLFFLAMFLVHPLIGWLGVVGAGILLLSAMLTEIGSRKPVKQARDAENLAQTYGNELARNRAAIVGMGMSEPLLERWTAQKRVANHLTTKGGSIATFFGSHARGFRLMLQVAALGIGAWLALQQHVTMGAIVAGSILLGRALAPIDQCLGAWRQIVRARQGWHSLRQAMKSLKTVPSDPTALPRPESTLRIDGLKVSAPGTDKPILPAFNLTLSGGKIVAVLGASGTGKSSLLHTLAGAWQPHAGSVRLGGRDIHNWASHDRGKYVGYLPQDVELVPGTISENICRFTDVSDEEIIETAKRVGVHDLLLHLPDGYDTVVGMGGHRLSKGQSQAVGLSRAFFGLPVLLCLDEPSANIDQVLFSGLARRVAAAGQDGAMVFIATHDRRIVELSDQVILLGGGDMKMVSASDYLETMRSAPALPSEKDALR